MATPLSKEKLQPVVDGADKMEKKEGTFCLAGRRFKTATIVSIVAVAMTAIISATAFVRTWGLNEGRIGTLEEKASTAHSVQEQVRSRLGTLERQQTATQTTVEAVQTQQQADRKHFDDRLDRIYDAITRRR